MTKFEELKQRFPNTIPVPELRANVSIIELAVQYGYEHLTHKGRSRPVLQHPGHGDTIIIKNPQDASQQVYQRADDFSDSGTIIDFIRNRLPTVFSVFNHPGQHEFRNVTNVLYDYLRVDPVQVARNRKIIPTDTDSSKQTFAKELFDIRSLEKDNYLLKRHIDPRIIQSPEFAGKAVTQVSYLNPETGRTEGFLTAKANPDRKYINFSNVAFPYYNGLTAEVMGFEIRNENLKQHAPGSDRYTSVFISNIPPKPQRFIVMESVLDAMAHKQLQSVNGNDAFDSVYFSTGGQLTQEQTNTISRYVSALDKSDDWKIILAFDNDAKGHRFDLMFVQQLVAPNFPTSPTVATANRVGLLLPEGAAHGPIREALIGRAESFNNTIRSQIENADGDEISRKELSSQLINIATLNNQQVALHVPETMTAMGAISEALLELTGFGKRIEVVKSCSKDYCEELKTHMAETKRYAYTVTSESGESAYNTNSAITAQRTLIMLQHQHTGDKQNKTFQLMLSQPDGWYKQQAYLEIKNGKVVKAVEQPEFKKQVLQEKRERSEKVQGKDQSINEPVQQKSTPKIKPQ
ncbi:hypothetical protein DUE52_23760 [Larkinella punicea]|uniref:Toprim domain-containing protein n=2 Tax=Spirosomataceae TaxID=2896860 RepID=A0A368JHI2_9BACT|nr:hypothetical protein DUE52_23760 [Larkinella punicea]